MDPTLRTRYDGNTDAVFLNAFNHRFLETTRIDVTRAASGGCVRQSLWDDLQWYCSGVVSHGGAYSTLFRRDDEEFWAFVSSFSEYGP